MTTTEPTPTVSETIATAPAGIDIDRKALAEAIAHLSTIAGKGAGLPILSCLLLENTPDGLRLTANNLDTEIRRTVPVEGGEGEIHLCVEASRLGRIVTETAVPTITLHQERGDRLVIAGGGSRFTLRGLPHEEFPRDMEFTERSATDIEGATLSRRIGLTVPFASKDETRRALMCVHLLVNDHGIQTVATDGRRLCLSPEALREKTDHTFNLPVRAATSLQRLLGDTGQVSLRFGRNKDRNSNIHNSINLLRVIGDGFTFTTRDIEENYPNYRQIIPKPDQEITLDRKALITALRRFGNALDKEHNETSVTLEIKPGNQLVLRDNNKKGGISGRETLEYNWVTTKREGTEIAFNHAYLSDAVKIGSEDTVNLAFTDATSPAIFRDDSETYLHILMPVRIQ